MTAGVLDIVIEQGATFELPLLWTDAVDAPIDLTGKQARMHVRIAPNASVFILELTTENDRIVLGGTAGTIDLLVEAVDTALLPPGEFTYDLEIVDGLSVPHVVRLLNGGCSIRAEVTK